MFTVQLIHRKKKKGVILPLSENDEVCKIVGDSIVLPITCVSVINNDDFMLNVANSTSYRFNDDRPHQIKYYQKYLIVF